MFLRSERHVFSPSSVLVLLLSLQKSFTDIVFRGDSGRRVSWTDGKKNLTLPPSILVFFTSLFVLDLITELNNWVT